MAAVETAGASAGSKRNADTQANGAGSAAKAHKTHAPHKCKVCQASWFHSWCSIGRCRCHPPPLCTPSALPGAPVTGTALRSACIERLRVCIGVTLHICRAQCVRITCRQQEAFDGALLDSCTLATLLSFFTDDISCPTRPRHATNRQAHRGREPIFATA